MTPTRSNFPEFKLTYSLEELLKVHNRFMDKERLLERD